MISILLAFALLAAPQASSPPLSAQAQAALDAFRAKIDAVRERHRRAGPPESVAGEIARMAELDQTARKSHGVPESLDDADADAAEAAIWRDIDTLDAANTERLKALVPKDGWFRASRDGVETGANAWLIVQHSPDNAFMERTLAHMGPLARRGEVNGHDYALLLDRVAMFKGKPQIYGSQGACDGSRWIIWPVRDPATVDERRAEIGFGETQAQTVKRLPIGKPCTKLFVPPNAGG
jgi:multidrug efflux pump subunit AcrA (membrane-fusion protein)